MMRRLLARLSTALHAGHADRELAREIDAHLQLLEDDFVARGMSQEQARYAARRAFGGQVEQTKLRHRDARAFRWMTELWLDITLGVRMLVRYPGLTLVGGMGMAAAIAISTASFAFFFAYLSSTLPFEEGDRIVALENWDLETNNEERQALHDFVAWRDELTSFEEIGAFRNLNRNLVIPGGTTEPVRIAEVTASAFRITRVPPLLGRPLLDADEAPGAAPVIVIGQDVWRTRFAAHPNVIGRQIRLGNQVHTIVGVMPEGFLFPINHSYWKPLDIDTTRFARGQGPEIFIFGRLAPGVSVADANTELAAVGQRMAATYPDTHARLRPQVLPYAYPILDIQDASLWQVAMMQLMVSMVLIVVAVNVAILVYARTATRQGEIAVRTALGASRPRIIAQLFVEALVLALLSAVVGLALATLGLDQAHRVMATESVRPPFWIDYGVPWAAVIYVVGLSVVAALIAGVLPAFQATSRRVQSTLRALSGSTGMRLGRTWTLLIVAQVAFAVAAVPMALGVGWREVRSDATRPVFAAEQFLAAAFAMDPEPPDDIDAEAYRRDMNAQFSRHQSQLVSRLEAESWVADVTLAMRPPGQEGSARVEVAGVRSTTAAGHEVGVNRVDVDFFDAVDARIVAGRGFHTVDRTSATSVVVNRAFAHYILRDADVLGRRLRYPAHTDEDGARDESPWFEIVGVVGDLHANAINPEIVQPVVYHPLAPGQSSVGSVIVRVSGGTPASYTGRLREITAAIDPSLRLDAYPLVEIYQQSNLVMRLVAGALGLVIASVLLLSAAGIYALMSFTVSQRRKEIGIRAALGADGRQLLRSIFARAAWQLCAGVGVGMIVAIVADSLRGGELMGVEGRVLAPAMAIVMILVGLLAAAGPARRGLTLQPTQALRDE
jgi:putative ABC transport system permease protein